jgi:hypothetical protein
MPRASLPSPSVRVHYVSGQTIGAEPHDWPALPSEGVDWVEMTNEVGTIRVAGHSLYWLYREGPNWVIGGGSIGYTNALGETVVGDEHRYREIEYMPDLPHSAVKMGAWWPGKERRG